ncbi:DUF7619 domain-containing protein [Flavobacterium silvaticum]|uniref:T9SS type A sorting domain-containing protein n=1 Tax=Flavobacterium silvaticum TaxID=1852020 RepID=A0A972FLU5_9FLAO|nr:T9SS type A sorting domain-containing protein [Flavobacterium silvaticum]NMH28113.1 T9SS type A sorting domain-containing protein [Flavobacterium silvaticum]
MNKYLLFLVLTLTFSASGQTISFADNDLRSYLAGANATNNRAFTGNVAVSIDTNSDGQIQLSEAAAITRLWIEYDLVDDLTGIENFANLTQVDFKATGIATANLSGMTNLQQIQFYQNPALTSVTISGMTALTQISCTENPLLASLATPGCDNVLTFIANQNALTSLDVSGKALLQNLYANNNALTLLNVSGCTALNGIVCTNNNFVTLDISNLPNLMALDISGNPTLENFNASDCPFFNATFITLDNFPVLANVDFSHTAIVQFLYSDHNLVSLHLSGCPLLESINVNNNQLTDLDVSECPQLISLFCESNQLASLDLSNLANFQLFNANDNPISSVDFTGDDLLSTVELKNSLLPDLDLSGTSVWLYSVDVTGSDNMTSLNLSGRPGLEYVDPPYNLITLDLSDCVSLHGMNLLTESIQTINVQGCASMEYFYIGMSSLEPTNPPISTLDVSGLSSLTDLQCDCPNLNSIQLEGCDDLETLGLFSVPLTSLDLIPVPNLKNLMVDMSFLETIDVSPLHQFQYLSAIQMPNLVQIFAKNAVSESIALGGNPSLTFICQDEEAVAATNADITSSGLSDSVTCNSYCSFTPGGSYNVITGTIRFDLDGNGCDASDEVQSAMRIDMSGEGAYSTFSIPTGQYYFYTGAGTFGLAMNLENPDLYTYIPMSPMVTFADNNNNTSTQDFCITPNGIQNDVEIVIAPIVPARPGFVALYQITIRNKGNQVQSGNINFEYAEDKMNYVSTDLPLASQAPGVLNWDYSDLLPFEHRSFFVVMNINTPLETSPVNMGDVLHFDSTINPITGDLTPTDNQFGLDQIVVASYDPNDITCLEGEIVPPSAIGKYLHYIVNFENLGTAEAENVVVRVDIDTSKFDMDSLQLMSTSNDAYTKITGNKVEFIFEHINLAPAAGNPPVGGHGNVLFKLKTLDTLVEEDVVMSRADIYFDYNFPIRTNDAETVFRTLSSGDFVKDESISIYPNPAKNKVTVKSENRIESVQLFDVQGRLLETVLETSTETKLDLSQRASGIYFMKINTTAGSAVKKVAKE